MSNLATFLDELSERYLGFHRAKEEAFWDTRMGIIDRQRELAEADLALKRYLGDPGTLAELRALRSGPRATKPQEIVLDGWILTFARNQVEDAEARTILAEIVGRESELQRARGSMKLGYVDPSTGDFRAASSVFLGNALRSDPDDRRRRAAFDGLRSIETHVLANGFAEIVKLRNKFARRLGFADYYDYKVWWAEGFDKKVLFGFLDDLEARTREPALHEIRALEERRGKDAILPWNFNFHTWGSLQEQLDPYFGFEDALERWARTFAALGVRYRNARVTLDLLDRRGKYENGFMHGPGPAYVRNGRWIPAAINFTANAVPGQTGSGLRAAETLFHEGGHAAHYANITMDAPCFSQEYAPTSVALAETQSMFMDELLHDADWQSRYAKDANGKAIPFELMERKIRLTHPFRAQDLRAMLAVCYSEKALYEANERELTDAGVLALLRNVERKLVQLPEGCPRPTLAVPHLLSWESSCYYHGYVLARMAVAQTRERLFETFGRIVDEPRIGETLARTYWAPGNGRPFLDLVQDMTGRPFSADALAREIALPVDDVARRARERVDRITRVPEHRGDVDLDLRLRVIHGAETIVEEGKSPLEAARVLRDWILERGRVGAAPA